MAKYLYVCIIALCMTCTVAARNVTGRWTGKLQVPEGQLTLVFRIQEVEGGKLSAFMDSPDQRAYDIPCDSVVYSAPHLKVFIHSIGARYEATLDGETLRGQFIQGGLRSLNRRIRTRSKRFALSIQPMETLWPGHSRCLPRRVRIGPSL